MGSEDFNVLNTYSKLKIERGWWLFDAMSEGEFGECGMI